MTHIGFRKYLIASCFEARLTVLGGSGYCNATNFLTNNLALNALSSRALRFELGMQVRNVPSKMVLS